MQKRISVIIPCYNCSKVIHHAMTSLMLQTIGINNIEIILIEDKSSDNSMELLQEYKERYPNIVKTIYNTKNVGQSVSRNTGIKHATGEYITFLDQDDWIVPEMYEQMYLKASSYQCDIVSAFHKNVFDYQDLPRMGRMEEEARDEMYEVTEDAVRRTILLTGATVLGGVCVWEKLFRREFILTNQIKFPEERLLYEDYFFMELCLLYVKRFYIMKCVFHYYLQHMDGTFLHRNKEYHLHKSEICLLLLEEYKRRKFDLELKEEIEAKFVVNYFVDGIHSIFTRFDDIPYDKLCNLKKTVQALYPRLSVNPYLNDADIRRDILGIHELQEKLYSLLFIDFNIEHIKRLQKEYWTAIKDDYQNL